MLEVLEEADNRIVCHIKDMLECGISRISIRTVDSDVVVILLRFMSRFLDIKPEYELYVDFNTGGNRKNIHINACYQSLGKDICLALPFFHYFSGADSTCSFYKMTKKAWFSHWMSFPMKDELRDSFQKLSWCPTEEAWANAQKVIENCVVYAYSSHIDDDLDEFRFLLFQRLCTNELRNLPPPPPHPHLLLHWCFMFLDMLIRLDGCGAISLHSVLLLQPNHGDGGYTKNIFASNGHTMHFAQIKILQLVFADVGQINAVHANVLRTKRSVLHTAFVPENAKTSEHLVVYIYIYIYTPISMSEFCLVNISLNEPFVSVPIFLCNPG